MGKSILNYLHIEKLVLIISFITLVSGLGQMLAPGIVLSAVSDGSLDLAVRHFFAIIGMFMALFGGLLLVVLKIGKRDPWVVLFCGLQKFGAFFAVSLGVINGIFSTIALLVAFFDLFSSVLIILLWRQLRQ